MTTTPRHRFFIPALASILYFSQGFPFGIYYETVNLYLSYAKVPLATIGLISSVGIAWTLKVFWAPLVDATGTYRSWIFGALVVLSLTLALTGVVRPASREFWILIAVLAVASATQDIAIDALTIRMTPADLVGLVNSARVAAYRAAMIVAGGGVAVLADRIGWRNAFYAAALVPLAVLLLMALTIPAEDGARQKTENPLRGLLDWLRRPGALTLLAVILLYRLGDSTMWPMIRPYWVSRGFSAAEVGNVTTTLGMVCTIAGAIVGGWWVSRYGAYNGLLVLGALQMLSNITYALVAMTSAGRPAMYGAAVVETFCSGLGTAAFLSFLMLICDKANAATEYAMLSAVFAISRTGAGAISGFLAEDLGYATFYFVTALLAIPGLALLPLIRKRLAAAEAVRL